MMRSLPILLLTGCLLVTTACSTTVQPGERGVLLTSSGLQKDPLEEGSYWIAPWSEVYIYDVRWQHYAENVNALSADDIPVTVDAAIVMRATPQEVKSLAQTAGTDYYARLVKPEFQAAVRHVVVKYPALLVTERSAQIGEEVQRVMEDKLRGRHLSIHSVVLSDVELPAMVLTAIEQKHVMEQQKQQKDFELLIAAKEAEIARARAKGDGDALSIRAEGQAKAQETIKRTLSPEYLRYKLYDNQNAKTVLLPDDLKLPVLFSINAGDQPSAHPSSAESTGQFTKPADQPPAQPPTRESTSNPSASGEQQSVQAPTTDNDDR